MTKYAELTNVIDNSPTWGSIDGRQTKYRNLTNSHLKNIWKDHHRNHHLLIEMLKRKFLAFKEVNSGVCEECGKVLVSVFVHDFQSCEHAFVDGGTDLFYGRYSGKLKKATNKQVLEALQKRK